MESSLSKTEASPQLSGRTGGFLYLIMIVLGIIQQVVIRGKMVIEGDAAATAANLKSMETLWRFGIAIELIMIVITVWVGLILYVLTKPVNKNLALLAVFFNMLATATGAAYSLQLIQALFPLGNTAYLNAFTQDQLYALTSIYIRSQSLGFGITLFLFAPFFFVTSYLIFKSGYLPKFLGLLYIIPGLSYSISSLLLILAPVFGAKYYFIIAGPAVIGELSLSLWLLIKGVNLEKWNTRL